MTQWTRTGCIGHPRTIDGIRVDTCKVIVYFAGVSRDAIKRHTLSDYSPTTGDRAMSKPKFAKRHYEAIAEVIREVAEGDAEDRPGAESVAYGLSDVFAMDNSRFDGERFLKACGVS